jgi:hypothetical protein
MRWREEMAFLSGLLVWFLSALCSIDFHHGVCLRTFLSFDNLELDVIALAE